jgi:PqqD family protein of HPr-rel-A system
MTNENTIVARREALLATEVDGEMVALHVDKGTCYGFNATATRIWAMIEEPKRLGEIRDALLEEFDVDPETCEREIRQLLKELEADGLVELQPA